MSFLPPDNDPDAPYSDSDEVEIRVRPRGRYISPRREYNEPPSPEFGLHSGRGRSDSEYGDSNYHVLPRRPRSLSGERTRARYISPVRVTRRSPSPIIITPNPYGGHYKRRRSPSPSYSRSSLRQDWYKGPEGSEALETLAKRSSLYDQIEREEKLLNDDNEIWNRKRGAIVNRCLELRTENRLRMQQRQQMQIELQRLRSDRPSFDDHVRNARKNIIEKLLSMLPDHNQASLAEVVEAEIAKVELERSNLQPADASEHLRLVAVKNALTQQLQELPLDVSTDTLLRQRVETERESERRQLDMEVRTHQLEARMASLDEEVVEANNMQHELDVSLSEQHNDCLDKEIVRKTNLRHLKEELDGVKKHLRSLRGPPEPVDIEAEQTTSLPETYASNDSYASQTDLSVDRDVIDYYPNTTREVEKAGLSVKLRLNGGHRTVHTSTPSQELPVAPEASAWRQPITSLTDKLSKTELMTVQASEYSTIETGVGRTTLVCPSGPRTLDIGALAQMRWLHVQQPALRFKPLERLVLNCPFVTEDARSVTMETLERVKEQFTGPSECGPHLELGCILRCVGTESTAQGRGRQANAVTPVLFLASPFLVLGQYLSRRGSDTEYRPRSLLQSLYGYDVGNERESGQVVQKVGAREPGKDVLHINQLWCLLIGSDVLITMSEQSAADIRGDTILVNDRSPGAEEPLVIRLVDKNDRSYPVVIEPDYSFAEFLKYAVALVAGHNADPSMWAIYKGEDILTPSRWVAMLESEHTAPLTLSVVLQQPEVGNEKGRSCARYPYYDDEECRPATRSYGLPYPHRSSSRDRPHPGPKLYTDAHLGSAKTEVLLARGAKHTRTRPRPISPFKEFKEHQAEPSNDKVRAMEMSAALIRHDRESYADSPFRGIREGNDAPSGNSQYQLSPVSGESTARSMHEAVHPTDSDGVNTAVPSPEQNNAHSSSMQLILRPEDALLPSILSDTSTTAEPTGAVTVSAPWGNMLRRSSPALTQPLVTLPRRQSLSREPSLGLGGATESTGPPAAELVRAEQRLSELLDKLSNAENTRDFHMAADLKYGAIPDMQQRIEILKGEGTQKQPHQPKQTRVEWEEDVKDPLPSPTLHHHDLVRRPSIDPGLRYARSSYTSSTQGSSRLRSRSPIHPWSERHVSARERSTYRRSDSVSSYAVNASNRYRQADPEIFQPREDVSSGHGFDIDSDHSSESSSSSISTVGSATSIHTGVGVKGQQQKAYKERVLYEVDAPVIPGLAPTLSTIERTPLGVANDSVIMRLILRRAFDVDGREIFTKRYELIDFDPETDSIFETQKLRGFYRSKPHPAADEKADWVDEYVMDIRPLISDLGVPITVTYEWPLLPLDEVCPRMRLVPFLQWRLKTGKDERTEDEVEKSLVSILGTIKHSISKSVVSRLYSRTYSCSLDDVLQRHGFLRDQPATKRIHLEGDVRDKMGDSMSAEPEVENTEADQTSKGDIDDDDPTPDPDTLTDSAKNSRNRSQEQANNGEQSFERSLSGLGAPSAKQKQSIQSKRHDKELMRRLFNVSREIFQAYMPDSGDHVNHHVCVRFWGAVDEIFRQVIWDVMDLRNDPSESFAVAEFDNPAKEMFVQHSKSWARCSACSGKEQYTSPDAALLHLHEHHFDCSIQSDNCFDDPCFVWIYRVRGTDYEPAPKPGAGHLRHLEEFLARILPITGYIRELHALVASASQQSTKVRPPLPSKVVYAFQEVVSMFVIQAHLLSFYNRRRSAALRQKAYINGKIERLIRQEEMSKGLAYDYLQDAKKDIILMKGTSRHIDGLGIESVGAEFLLMALVANLQNRPVLPHAPSTNPGMPDFLLLYQRYVSELRFEANRRPKKRVFLDIRALEEELDALHGLLDSQETVLSNYLKLLNPGSLRPTTCDRKGLFRIERDFGRRQQRLLRSKAQSISTLREKSQFLKEQVKQTIEILEEDHGKAIRVFTFVTLLFLPLSFVTSFMGMNVTDIRDTEFSQKIFWATGLPVTLVVVLIALLYAYRGEALQDWVWRRLRPRRVRGGRNMGGGFAWTDEFTGEGDAMLAHRGSMKVAKGIIHVDSDKHWGQATAESRGPGGGMRDVRFWDWDSAMRTLALRDRKKTKTREAGLRRRGTADR
ncbi:uncharacterized protein F5Z01DRAFT_432833 [Emericellopsis atlantica]|uniref:Uncharacterized protein n=1 Tax=Emericellopsis atlantica TaxID=2614577 RepID=A0A9P7ZDC1_9HYPO|nr:uncharacterized protein F5Z01DRAFT_432833 [Emericellopsis atlantica]KAG9250024.1 hypothetical protein F5Z01DRAFT_432833 [Emericellopsis atlantica]